MLFLSCVQFLTKASYLNAAICRFTVNTIVVSQICINLFIMNSPKISQTIQIQNRFTITWVHMRHNQNQNCYWWHVQMTIVHQDLWWGKLVPSSYQRSELSNRVFCSFSSRKESICEWIPISNSLGEETALVNVSISKGGLKCQRVMISDMPNWGEKVIRRYTGCTLQTFVKHYDSTISPPFFQRFPL